jgi:hypothetical protein
MKIAEKGGKKPIKKANNRKEKPARPAETSAGQKFFKVKTKDTTAKMREGVKTRNYRDKTVTQSKSFDPNIKSVKEISQKKAEKLQQRANKLNSTVGKNKEFADGKYVNAGMKKVSKSTGSQVTSMTAYKASKKGEAGKGARQKSMKFVAVSDPRPAVIPRAKGVAIKTQRVEFEPYSENIPGSFTVNKKPAAKKPVTGKTTGSKKAVSVRPKPTATVSKPKATPAKSNITIKDPSIKIGLRRKFS